MILCAAAIAITVGLEPAPAVADLFEEAVSGKAAQQTEKNNEPKWVWNINGHVRADAFVGKEPEHMRVELKSAYSELAIKALLTRKPYVDFFGELRLKVGYLRQEYLGKPGEANGQSKGEIQDNINPRELYVNAYLGPLDLRIGRQIIVWGRADGINPTNNLTPIDLRVRSPEEDDRRMGNLAARANLNFSPIRIEGVFVPFYRPSYFPKITLMNGLEFLKPDYPETEDFGINTILLAGRIHLLLPAFEISLSYLHGNALLPGVVLDSFQLNDQETISHRFIALRRSAYVQHVIGMDFSTAIGEFMGLKGEVAYRLPAEYDSDLSVTDPNFYMNHGDLIPVPTPDIYYVLGVDKEFGDVSVIAQYVGRYVFSQKAIPDAQTLIDDALGGRKIDLPDNEFKDIQDIPSGLGNDNIYRMLINRQLLQTNRLLQGHTKDVQHGASLRLEWRTLHDTLSLVAFGMMNFSTKEWLVYPKIAYSITDTMVASVGGEIYNGPKDTIFNMIEEVLSAGYAEFKVSF